MNYYKISQHAALANNPEFLGCITNGVGLKRQLNMTNEFLLPRFDPPPILRSQPCLESVGWGGDATRGFKFIFMYPGNSKSTIM